jgi:hypothetical protein
VDCTQFSCECVINPAQAILGGGCIESITADSSGGCGTCGCDNPSNTCYISGSSAEGCDFAFSVHLKADGSTFDINNPTNIITSKMWTGNVSGCGNSVTSGGTLLFIKGPGGCGDDRRGGELAQFVLVAECMTCLGNCIW